jgi:uncharacterized damage-inducible protein DinB
MEAVDVIKNELNMGMLVLKMYLEDMSDDELKIRPASKGNSLAWQIGHLICSEHRALTEMGASMPKLSKDFIEEHSFENAPETNNEISKDEYLRLYFEQRAATEEFVNSLSASDLDKPGPEYMKDYAPTIGSVLVLQGSHMMMHAGQIAVFRREYDKKIVI